MRRTLCRAERHLMGMALVAAPILAAVALSVAGAVMAVSWPPAQVMTLTAWFVQIFAICAGISVAVAVTGDPMIEMHESTVTGFRTVELIRWGIVTSMGITGAVIVFAVLHLCGVWPRDTGWSSVLFPVGEVLFLATIALMVSALSVEVSATTIAVVASWMFLALLWDPYVLPLLPGRGIPLLVSGGCAAVAWCCLGDSEHSIRRVTAA